LKILVINGPNMNLLGNREKGLYGEWTLEELNSRLVEKALRWGMSLEFFQSNHEGEIVDRIQASGDYDLVIINPAAYTHTSVAIRDALSAVGKPVIEVHMTNVYQRESFRHHSYISDVALGKIVGFGVWSYFLALEAARHILGEESGYSKA